MSEKYIIPIFVPHLGCPNNCTFCNQKSISGQMKNVTGKEVKETIEQFLNSFKNEEIEASNRLAQAIQLAGENGKTRIQNL